MSTVGSVAMAVAAIASIVAIAAAAAQRASWASRLLAVCATALAVATGALVGAIARLDLSVAYVAAQSRARSGGPYRFAALWGGSEGSLLLFTAMLMTVVAFAAWRYRLGRWGTGVGAAIGATLTVTIAAFANPFAVAELPPIRGRGLTPILEHPAMLYHPPILYAGLVMTAVSFLAAVDRSPVVAGAGRVPRPMLIAWTLLTVGLATGANWAYVEVGWGGYWAWDPVENTVLLPWLVLTAAIHVGRSGSLQARFPRAARVLAAAPFVLVAFGTAVTRSGGLSSVHAFADADALGWMLGSLVVGLVVVVVARVAAVSIEPHRGRVSPRQAIVGASAALTLAMTIAVLLGVALPLLPGSDRIVPASYYNRIGAPVLVVGLGAMAAAPMAWEPMNPVVRRTAAGVVAGLVVGLGAGVRDAFSLAAVALVGAVVVSHLVTLRSRKFATIVGHVGFAVLAIGIVGSAAATTSRAVLEPGESVAFGSNLELDYVGQTVVDGPRAGSEAAILDVRIRSASGDVIAELESGLVSYPDRAVVLAETALYSTPRRDIQVVVETVAANGTASIAVSERPFLMLVWWGSTLIALAGIVATVSSRRGSVAVAVGTASTLARQ